MPSDFVHLHVHTEYSLLDGQSQIDLLMKRAQELEQPAMAITDHGVMFGAIDFFRAAKGAGVKPIIGMEAYLAPRGMRDRDAVLDKKPFHLLLLARNQVGYQNLCKLASLAQLEGYYYRPRIDKETLHQYREGIIATTGCLAAEVPRLLEEGKEEQANAALDWYYEIFGAENFYLELQNHDIEQLKVLNRWLYEYRQRNRTPIQFLATNDVHYVRHEDWQNHDTLLCIQTGALKSETNRMTLEPFGSYYLKSADEMRRDFGDMPAEMLQEAFANTLKIAEMCDVNLDNKQYHLPVFPVPAGFTSTTYLRFLAEMGLKWRYPGRENDPALRQRLDHELKIIDQMGFNTYFLIVWDLCEFARSADIWWNVRGSGAGCLTAYCLGITGIDPIQNNLLFERFLNPGRVSMPDIDLDYPDNQRGEMIAYAVEKYGEDKVAAIITFGTMGAKASVKDVGKALGVESGKILKAAAMIPQEAKQRPLPEYVAENPELKVFYEGDKDIREVIDTAAALQGMSRHTSMHAAGVIISDAPLDTYLPLHKLTGNTDVSDGALKRVTQFPMETAESIGLLKVDFLGLSTLTILRKACELVERHHGIPYRMGNIPYRHDDPTLTADDLKKLDETYQMMGRGETIGVFQLESTGMQQMLRGMRPFRFEHIIAAVSLYRPGPMDFIPMFNRRMHGEEETVYLHPKLEPIIKETYGILVYQEQLMQVASDLFGYNLGEADLMRRAVSKKKEKDLKQHKAIFMERGPERGIEAETAEKIFDEIEFFANYGFNKCVVGSTQIIDADSGRLVTVQALYDEQAQVHHTITLDTNTHHLTTGNVSAVLFNGIKPVYRLKTRSGRQIDATGNHPFYTPSGWRNLADLKVGEALFVPTYLPVAGKSEWSEMLLMTCAKLLAKGNFWVLERCVQKGVILPEIVEQLRLQLHLDAALITAIPADVFALTNVQLAYLLAAWWSEVGRLDERSHTPIFRLPSAEIARQVQHLLLRFGIHSWQDELEVQFSDVYGVDLKCLNFQRFAEWILTPLAFVGEHYRALFPRSIEVYEHLQQQTTVLEAALAQRSLWRTQTDAPEMQYIDLDEIRSIELLGEQPTYDLTIDKTHNFIANDLIVHNSHAADYAWVTVQTAFLKAHFPEEFMTALLCVQFDDSDKVAIFLEECRRLQIPILPPDVNYSQVDFDIQILENGKRAIRFGMGAIKHAGVGVVQYILDCRADTIFASLEDFLRRCDLRVVGKKALESLIKVGALAGFGYDRDALLEQLESLINFSIGYHKAKETGQKSLFSIDGVEEKLSLRTEASAKHKVKQRDQFAWEKELLGLYVTGRPVDNHKDKFRYAGLNIIAEMRHEENSAAWNGKNVRVAGEVISVRKIVTKNNQIMLTFQLEDWHDTAGVIEVVMFPRTWQKISKNFADRDTEFAEGEIVQVVGSFDVSRDSPQIIAEDVTTNFTFVGADGQAELPPMTTPAYYDRSNMSFDEDGNAIEYDYVGEIPPPTMNGNGHANGNGNGKRTLPAYIADFLGEKSQTMKRHVRVYLKRSGDAEQDKRRLHRLHGIFSQHSGDDTFSVVVEGGGLKSIVLDFSETVKTRYSRDLLRELATVVTETEIVVR